MFSRGFWNCSSFGREMFIQMLYLSLCSTIREVFADSFWCKASEGNARLGESESNGLIKNIALLSFNPQLIYIFVTLCHIICNSCELLVLAVMAALECLRTWSQQSRWCYVLRSSSRFFMETTPWFKAQRVCLRLEQQKILMWCEMNHDGLHANSQLRIPVTIADQLLMVFWP